MTSAAPLVRTPLNLVGPARPAALLLAVSVAMAAAPAVATENIVFVSGAFRRTIYTRDLESFVRTGVPSGLLADVLRFSKQNPASVRSLLTTELPVPVTLTSRLLNTRIGVALLTRATAVVHPLRAPRAGVPALRSALVLGVADGGGKLSPLGVLRAYPAEEMAIDLPQLLGLLKKASTISDLVRFFSEAPLDGLRGS